MKGKWRLLVSSLLMVGLLFMLAGCGGKGADKAAEKPKKIIVGTNATFPPFESQEKGELVGFDIDLIRAICEVQGYEVEIKHMGFEALIPAVQQGKIDAAISGMSITEERQKVVDFSDPYFNAGLIIAVRNDNTTINSTDDLRGKKLAAQTGTIGAAYCDRVKEQDPSTVVKHFKDIGEAFMELKKGGVDAVINDYPVTLNYILTTEDANIKMVGEVFSADDKYGIAVKKGNTELLNMINEGLKKIKENGTYDKIYQKYFQQ
ncbi:amino acid ABC transporter substrate-binding protein, PAAT family [Thermosyntropha lipolytica DSM 11003]|uniref:Amino acid ABC transporter substrate-binding protein, PAAT family n=1 Tax=Thermosyntropha lipolytica DSM 11003 TaxID=1123382 RepID=A0A1M5K8Z7_9FIRM|nr:basic amino acid ABC transporter substrate-binding protein [Thermosyntropha lipolytica]SHG49314.1 amino acid ABC transporter substrate-binding protein, PAAT family [Thermosyntropha lipolytica DSM 11003]